MLPALIALAGTLAKSGESSGPAGGSSPSGVGAFVPVFTIGAKIVGRDNSAPQSVTPTTTNTPVLNTTPTAAAQPYYDPIGTAVPAAASVGQWLPGVSNTTLIYAVLALVGILAAGLLIPGRKGGHS